MRMVALGDSISCGEGVGVAVHLAHTWVGVLAHGLGADLQLLARRGARTSDVRGAQLPVALAAEPQFATVLMGLNDVSRTGWDADRVRADLTTTVTALRAQGVLVLLVRLYDPTVLLPLPARVRRAALARVAVVNDTVDSLRGPGVVVLDLASVRELRRRNAWAVDRVHPGISGHRAIAASAAEVLREHGVELPNRLGPVTAHPPLGRTAELRWLARHGAPYLLRGLARAATGASAIPAIPAIPAVPGAVPAGAQQA